MPGIHETAYPRLKSTLILEELREIYTPTPEEVRFCDRVVKRIKSKLQFLILLKNVSTPWAISESHRGPSCNRSTLIESHRSED